MNGYVLLIIELAAILAVCVALALFLGWVLGKRSARAALAAGQKTKPAAPAPELEALTALRNTEQESQPLDTRAVPVARTVVPVEAQTDPATTQPPSPLVMASTPGPQPTPEAQPVSHSSPFAPDPSLYAGPAASADPPASAGNTTGTSKTPSVEAPQPGLLDDATVSDDSVAETHMIPRITGQTPAPAPSAEPAADPRLLDAQTRADDAEAKAREAEARVEEANKRADDAEAKAQEAEARIEEAQTKVQEAEAKIEEADQHVTQADQRVSDAEARAAEAGQIARAAEARATEAEARAQEADQHISDAEQARRHVVELEERINRQEIDMARLENRATAAWDKTMPTLIERIESLEGDLSQARREAAELQALLDVEREHQQTATPQETTGDAEASESTESAADPEAEEEAGVPQTEIIREEPWQAIGSSAGATHDTPIAFASSTLPDMQPAEDAPAEKTEAETQSEPTVDEKDTDGDIKDETTTDEEAAGEEAEANEASADVLAEEATESKNDDTTADEPESVITDAPSAADSTVAEEQHIEDQEHTGGDHEHTTDASPEQSGTAAADPEPTDALDDQEPDAEEEPRPTEETADQAATAEPAEMQEVQASEQLTPTAAVEHEVILPSYEDNEEEQGGDEQQDEPDAQEPSETRLIPLIPEPTFTDFEEFTAARKAQESAKTSIEEPEPAAAAAAPEKLTAETQTADTMAWPEFVDEELTTTTRPIPIVKDEPAPRPIDSHDLSALTDTGSFARLIAPSPAPQAPSFAPLDIPEPEHHAPTASVYPVAAHHHDDATVPDIPRVTAPIARPFEAVTGDTDLDEYGMVHEDTSGWRRTTTPAAGHLNGANVPARIDLLVDETEADEVPVTAGLPEPERVTDSRVNAGHIVAPQFSMTEKRDGILRSPLDKKGEQLSISLEEDHTLADPIDDSIAVMETTDEEYPRVSG